MTAPELLIEQIEAAGGVLSVNGDHIRYQIPEEAADLLDAVKNRKSEVLAALKERSKTKESKWPPASLDAERRFTQPHAKLFAFIGRKVRTPAGPGTLLQVFAQRVTVVLDSELGRCSFFQPTEIEPVCWELL